MGRGGQKAANIDLSQQFKQDSVFRSIFVRELNM